MYINLRELAANLSFPAEVSVPRKRVLHVSADSTHNPGPGATSEWLALMSGLSDTGDEVNSAVLGTCRGRAVISHFCYRVAMC